MATSKLYSFCSVFLIISTSYVTAARSLPPPADLKKVYIVYLIGSEEGHEAQHLSILRKVVGSEAGSRIIYSYRTFNAFSAKLTDKERDQLSKLKEVAYVSPSNVYQLEPVRA